MITQGTRHSFNVRDRHPERERERDRERQRIKYCNHELLILTVNRALSSIISYPIIGILKHEAFVEAASEGIMSLNLEQQ
jgi:hypothetical protein